MGLFVIDELPCSKNILSLLGQKACIYCHNNNPDRD